MTQKKPALIGRLAVQLKLITPQQLVEAVTAQRPDQKLGESASGARWKWWWRKFA